MAKQQQMNGGAKKPRISAQQKKIRLQQIIMAVIGIVVILAMILALVMS
jgi:hypothetical protein